MGDLLRGANVLVLEFVITLRGFPGALKEVAEALVFAVKRFKLDSLVRNLQFVAIEFLLILELTVRRAMRLYTLRRLGFVKKQLRLPLLNELRELELVAIEGMS